MFSGDGFCGSSIESQIIVNGSRNNIECVNQTDFVLLSGTSNVCKVHFGSPTAQMCGHGNKLTTLGHVRELAISGSGNTANIGMNVGNIGLYGEGHQVIVGGDAAHVYLFGDSSNVTIEGNVESLTIGGNINLIHIRGHCMEYVQIKESKPPNGERTLAPPQIQRNLVYIAGTAQVLNIDNNGYRNKIQCGRIEKILLDGEENRVKSSCRIAVDSGTNNEIEHGTILDAPVAAPDDCGDNNGNTSDEQQEQCSEDNKQFDQQQCTEFDFNHQDSCQVQ